MTVPKKIPAGVLLNNPGNIRHSSDHFQGEVESPDLAFKAFDTVAHGLRAVGKILLTYKRRYGLTTVATIIGRWAPPVENNTAAYIKNVCFRMGVTADEVIDVTRKSVLMELIAAITHQEQGYDPYSFIQISQGTSLALAA